MTAHTVWLASYPKSGNTWLRIFLANLLHPTQASGDFRQLIGRTPIAASRVLFETMLGVSSALLTPAETARLRPAADQRFAALAKQHPVLRKAHDAYTWLPDGRPLLGQSPDFAAIYILRDPRDVAVSMASHFDCSLEEAVTKLCDHDLVGTMGDRRDLQFPQRLLSWEGHVMSWLKAPIALHVMRYEDMHHKPLPVFRAAMRFLGYRHDDAAIEAALNACRFARLQDMEERQGFPEIPPHAPRFFRSGRVGEGATLLSPHQTRRLDAMLARVEAAIAEKEAS